MTKHEATVALEVVEQECGAYHYTIDKVPTFATRYRVVVWSGNRVVDSLATQDDVARWRDAHKPLV